MTPDTAYWSLAVIAQSGAAIMAIIIAGYIFFQKELRTDDESLFEIYTRIKRRFFALMVFIVICYAVTILVSVLILITISNIKTLSLGLNGTQITEKMLYVSDTTELFVYIAYALFAVSIAATIGFVYLVLHPMMIQRTARGMLKQLEQEKRLNRVITLGEFLRAFNELESVVDDLLHVGAIKLEQPVGFYKKINALKDSGMIDQDICGGLHELRKYRNLLVHSTNIEFADSGMLDKLVTLKDKLNNLEGSDMSESSGTLDENKENANA